MDNARKKRIKKSDIGYGYDSFFPTKLRELMERSGITQERLATALGVSRQAIAQWKDGNTTPDIFYLEKLSMEFNISCDHLLGRTRAAAPDDFIQEVVKRYGLSEQTLKLLESLNSPLNIDATEKERIIAEQQKIENDFQHNNKEFIVFSDGYATNRELSHKLSPDDFQKVLDIERDKTNKQALSILNDILAISTERYWESYGFHVLVTLWNYCYREYSDIEQIQHGATGRTYYTLAADAQRKLELHILNDIIAELRNELKSENTRRTSKCPQ